nr:UHRF1 binding protein 1 [Hymenolepis microstoma]
MVVDSIDVIVEVLEIPRQPTVNGSASSYRPSSGRYGLVERGIDGISLCIHELSAELISKVFKASVNLSHIILASKTPNWVPGPLGATFIPVPERNSILIFKEISWESTHFKADGFDERMTPVKIITNRTHLRVVLKKRLSDSSLLCAKMTLLIESLLWVLSVSQLEATIVFLKFLKRSMKSASDANPLKMKPVGLDSSVIIDPTIGTPSMSRSSDSRLIKAFDYYNIKENSFHLEANLIEMHFCEDNLRSSSMSTQLVEGGFVRMTMKSLHLDHYPAHPNVTPRKDWTGYSEINCARNQWLQSLKPSSDPDNYIFTHLKNPKIANVFESVVIFRLQDITVTCVMLDNQKEEERWPLPFSIAKNHKRRTVLEALDGEQKSLISNSFLASDVLMHKLPVKTDLIAMDFTQCLSSESPDTVLPMILFAQINPLHIKFDVDTIIWLNAFLLNLTANLQSLFGETENTFAHQTTPPPLFYRVESLMPRVILPMVPPPYNVDNSGSVGYPWTGPSALVMQIDQVILQTVPPPITPPMAKALSALLDNLEKQRKPSPAWGRDHIPPDFALFREFVEQVPLNSLSNPQESNGLLVSLHCPTVWAEFLTICEAAQRHFSGTPTFKTYRQAFFDPAPFTCWALAPSWPLWFRPPSARRYPVTWSPDLGRRLTSPPTLPAPISLLIDLDTSANFFSMSSSSNRSKPLHFTIGHSGAAFTFCSVERLRLPDAVDHLVFLYGIAFRLARLKASMGLDSYDILARKEENGEVKRYHEWLITAKCLITHGVEVEVISTLDSRYIDPPADFHVSENERALSSLSSGSSTKPPIDSLSKSEVEGAVNSTLSSSGEVRKNSLISERPIVYGAIPQELQVMEVSKDPGFPNSSSGLFTGCPPVSHSNSSILDDSDSFELILSDDEVYNDSFGNNFDEILPSEMGVDIANSDEFEERSNTVINEEQAVNFPPWKVQRLMLDLEGLSIDADISTIEARLWVGVASVGFFDPDDLEDDLVDNDNNNEDEVKFDIGDISTPLSSPAFLITLRFGGDALPGQPQTLLSPYDGWMAMHVGMMKETTLYPVPTSWEVLESLLGHWTSRGGVRAFHHLVTHGPGAGSMPLTNPPQLLDLTFCLEKGNLVLDLTARPRKWGKRSRRDVTLGQTKSKAPIQKANLPVTRVKLLQGFSASLNGEGVLEVCGALPVLSRINIFTPSLSQPSTALMSPKNGAQSPMANVNLSSKPNSLPNSTSSLITNRSEPSNSLLTNVSPAECPTSPPIPPRRAFSRGPSFQRKQKGHIPPLLETQASLAEENAKLHLMVNRLQSQVLALTADLTNLKTRYSK